MSSNRGFSLIELVLVILLVGVLSAFALARFADLGSEAKRAKIEGAAGAIQTASSIVASSCRVRSDCDRREGPAGGNGIGNSILIEGEPVILAYGYPRDSQKTGIARAANLVDLEDGGDYHLRRFTAGDGGLRVRPDAETPANECEVRYSQPGEAGQTPDVELELSGC